jgi:hypothetical protein
MKKRQKKTIYRDENNLISSLKATNQTNFSYLVFTNEITTKIEDYKLKPLLKLFHPYFSPNFNSYKMSYAP